MCDHIMIMSNGKLAASGSPEELQEMMHVKVELELTVLGTREQADEILRDMEQVLSYHFAPTDEDGAVRIVVDTAENTDIRKELSIALSGAGMPILSMKRIEKSLEDIFLKLTGTDTEEFCDETEEGEEGGAADVSDL